MLKWYSFATRRTSLVNFTYFYCFWNSKFYLKDFIPKISFEIGMDVLQFFSDLESFLLIFGVSGFSFRAIELKFMWQISWKILVYFGLDQVQNPKII